MGSAWVDMGRHGVGVSRRWERRERHDETGRARPARPRRDPALPRPARGAGGGDVGRRGVRARPCGCRVDPGGLALRAAGPGAVDVDLDLTDPADTAAALHRVRAACWTSTPTPAPPTRSSPPTPGSRRSWRRGPACARRARSTAPNSRCARSSASRSRSPGRARCSGGSPRRTGTRSRAGHRTCCSRPPATLAARRPGDAAAAAGPRAGAGGARRRGGRRAGDPRRHRRARRRRRRLLALPGIGPWTERYLRMRVSRDPDVLLVPTSRCGGSRRPWAWTSPTRWPPRRGRRTARRSPTTCGASCWPGCRPRRDVSRRGVTGDRRSASRPARRQQ